MTKPKPSKRPVSLVRSHYQPSKKELEEPVEFPDDLTPDELAEMVVRAVDTDWSDRPR